MLLYLRLALVYLLGGVRAALVAPGPRDDGEGSVAAERRGLAVSEALLSAVLFGVATPFSKSLLQGLPANQLAGLLYLGAALALLPAVALRWRRGEVTVPRDRRNRVLLLAAIVFGGVLGPVSLLVGLRHAQAASVSMWLNLETVATAVLAWLFFREHLGRWTWVGNAGIVGAGLLLSFEGGWAGAAGILGVAGAALCWGVDNNVTSLIDGISPLDSTFWKGLVAGSTNLAIGAAVAPAAPGWPWLMALALGSVSYGASIVLYINSAQALGAARSQMLFSTSPFFGVVLSVLWLGERMTGLQLAAGAVLAASVALIMADRHEHEHAHEAQAHEHRHRHDDGHHGHVHEEPVSPLGHSHAHVHQEATHQHPHWPDLHHRHAHG